jgi:hypothetical protein
MNEIKARADKDVFIAPNLIEEGKTLPTHKIPYGMRGYFSIGGIPLSEMEEMKPELFLDDDPKNWDVTPVLQKKNAEIEKLEKKLAEEKTGKSAAEVELAKLQAMLASGELQVVGKPKSVEPKKKEAPAAGEKEIF